MEKWEEKCTMCGKLVHCSTIEYSQGSKVCRECKMITQPADNAAYDRWVNSR